MADTAKKTKPTATPRQASASKAQEAEAAKPAKAVRKGIELVAKVVAPKKVKAAAAEPAKPAAKKPAAKKTVANQENVVAISQTAPVSREMIEQFAYQIWVQRGFEHGHALEDWIRAEQELHSRAS